MSLHTTFLPCMTEHKRAEGEHRVAHEQVNWDSISISVLPSMDSAGFPVALSCPQCLKFFHVWTLRHAETYFTHQSHSTDLSTNKLQYVFSTWCDLYIIWFKEKKCFWECLCMNLNFKLFLFLFSFIKSTDLFWEKKLCKYLIYFISRKQKIYVWLRHREQCFWLKRCIDWGSSTQIWISALWMYYSSVLNPVECSSARLFNLLRCHFFYYYLLYIFFNWPILLILVTLNN